MRVRRRNPILPRRTQPPYADPVPNPPTHGQEDSVNHFSIAFGTIIAAVIGGAVVLDHVTSNPNKTPRAAPTTSSTTESAAPSPADVSVNTSENAKIAMADG